MSVSAGSNLLSVFSKTPFAKEFTALCREKGVTVEVDSSEGSLSSLLIGCSAKNKKKILVISLNEEHCHRLITDLHALLPHRNIFYFPGPEILDEVVLKTSSRDYSYQMKALHALLNSANSTEDGVYPPIIVTTPEGITAPLPAPEKMSMDIFTLSNGQVVETDDIAQALVDRGYQPCSSVVSPGQFSIRGGIVDVFSSHERFPVRLELWGDEIDSMRTFDPYTQRSVEDLSTASFMPCPDGEESDLKNELRAYESLEKNGAEVSAQVNSQARLGEYFEDGSLFYWNVSPLGRKNAALITDRAFPAGSLNRTLLDFHNRMKCVFLKGCQLKDNSFKTVRSGSQPVFPFGADLVRFVNWVREQKNEKNFVALAMSSEGEVHRLSELLENYSISFRVNQPRADARVAGLYRQTLNSGFQMPGFSMIGASDLWEERSIVDDESFGLPQEQRVSFADFTELSEGCLVVHVENGVGKFIRLNSLLIEGVRQEFLEIEYGKGDKLFVPVTQLDRVQKFIGNEGGRCPKLNRLGGSRWAQAKGKVKKSVEKLARELLKLYAAREAVEGVACPPDTVWQREMEDSFPFVETRDQNSALREMKRLLEKPSPMDLLLCGDVGYGKTELAIRAAFKVVQEGRQVAVLVPTTILAHQHNLTFSGRLAPFPVKIEVMSRLKGTTANRGTAKKLAIGEIDIVIGTHRILSKDVRFKNLGLLIIDEEQRFGVKAKEKIKELKTSVDVLSLSATPIPRTLNLALSGARDISVINTPPRGRLPVRTVVEEHDDNLVKGAIQRELSRGGQVYYVNNRIEGQDLLVAKLRKLVPDARIRAGHGRMKSGELESLMMDFYNRKFDVLISTTIIESGLDIPNVNTMIIEDSHRFGLSQLYQLRGRVGRTTRQAYAFLLYPSKMVLPEIAFKRLKAIEDFSDLGSGFKVAMRDLELRGAGSILGSSQHGFVQSVGFELYTRLLRDAVEELKGEGSSAQQRREPSVIELQADMFISEEYITCPETKMQFYRKLAEVNDFAALEDVVSEMKDRFGPYPERLESLIRGARIRVKASETGLKTIKQALNEIVFSFFEGAPVPEQLAGHVLANFYGRVSFRKTPVDSFAIELKGERNSSLLDLVEKVLWYR